MKQETLKLIEELRFAKYPANIRMQISFSDGIQEALTNHSILESEGLSRNEMSINKVSAEMVWDACFRRADYELRKAWYEYSNLPTPPDKQTFLSSLPDTHNDGLRELVEWIEESGEWEGYNLKGERTYTSEQILSKAKEILNRK
jgi:hypothetical protein